MNYVGGLRVGPDDDPDRYLLGPPVGSGAEGVLHSAVLRTVDGAALQVAVKVLHPIHLRALEEWHTRWREQVELLRSLHCAGVVRVRDGFLGPLPHAPSETVESRTLYLVMDWVDGEPLDEWVRRRPNRDPFDALKLLLPVAAALDLMHSGQRTGGVAVAHRDIKPSNIIVTEDGGVLIDFGLIRGLPTGKRLSGLAGTPGYMGPEVTDEGVYSPASDRYALAAVAYFVFTGVEPPTTHQSESLRAALARVPVLMNRPEVVDHLMAMLADDPSDRPVSLANWVGQLRNSSLPALPEVLRPEAPRRHPDAGGSSPDTRQRGNGGKPEEPSLTHRPGRVGANGPGTADGQRDPQAADTTSTRHPPVRRLSWASLAGMSVLFALVLAVLALLDDGGGERPTTTGSTPGGAGNDGSVTVPPIAAPQPTVPPITVVTIGPTADTYVNEGAPSMNFGPTSELYSRGNLGYVTYMRFRLPAAPIGKTLRSAVLTIRTTQQSFAGSAEPHAVWLASDAWVESDVTWNNRPPLTPTAVGTIEAPQVDTTYTATLNPQELQVLVGSEGTLAVTNVSREMRDNLNFWSSNFEVKDYRPQLTLTFS